MQIDPDTLEIIQNTAEKRFEVELDDQIAVLEYTIAGENIIFTHIEVPQAFTGRGVASQLTRAALNYARDHSLRVQPLCSFVAAYIRKHPEYQAITWGY